MYTNLNKKLTKPDLITHSTSQHEHDKKILLWQMEKL